MDYRSDRVLLTATANSVDITAYVSEASISYDLARRVSECTLRLYEWPSGIDYWNSLDVYCGLVADATEPHTHGALHRFTGYVWDPGHDYWPMRSAMLGRGPLILADRVRVPSDEEYDQAKAQGFISVIPYYLAQGMDLSVDPATGDTWRDSDMIEYVLDLCGLSAKREDPLGGNPHLLGTAAYEQFAWSRRESGLNFIEKLDTPSMGFRTYDAMPCCVTDSARTIRRTRVSMMPDVVTTKALLLEGRDLLAGSSLRRAPSLIKNCVRVEGANIGGVPMVWVSIWPHPMPPPGVTNFLDTEYFSSPLIERDTVDWAMGISAKEVADWTCHEKSHDWWEATVETWRDDPITAGDSVYVNAPRLAGRADTICNQAFWVQAVDVKVSAGKFRQTLRLRAPAYWAGAGSFLGNLQLGAALR